MVISLKNAEIYQKNERLVLHHLNLDIAKGDFVYLIGKTGSGKSSLLKSLYGDLRIVGDFAEVAGVNLLHLREKKLPLLRRKLGIVFQDFQLLHDRSVFDNLLFVLKATGWRNHTEMQICIHKVLAMVGLESKLHQMTYELSGGEQQRVAIARALLNNPELIIADEPTGNLDPSVSDDIMSLLYNISKEGTAVLMATHDYRLINTFAGKVYRCEDGMIKEEN